MAERKERKRLFNEHLLKFVPLAAHIRRLLDDRRPPRVRSASELEDHLIRRDAEITLGTVTGWGRYAKLFERRQGATAAPGNF